MGKFKKISEDAFKNIQMDAGVILKKFDPSSATLVTSDIIGATSGGISVTATPSFTDFGEDIDNVPANMKELKRLESWEIKASGTFVTVTPESAKSMLGLADIDTTDTTKVTARNEVSQDDFNDIWIVGDYGETDGGFVACHLKNALSTAGFSLQTSDNAKGTFSFEYTAHYSIDAQDEVPFEVYVKSAEATTQSTTKATSTKAVSD